MDHAEIRAVVSAVLAEQQGHFQTAVEGAVAAALVSFGIHEDERKELRADFQHLRKWRKSVEQAQGWLGRSIVATLVTGFAGAVLWALKTYLGK